MSKPSCHPRTRPFQDELSTIQPTLLATTQQEGEGGRNDLVRLIAWQIFSRVPRHASIEVNDVMQAGYLGLLRARRSYRSDCDVPFPIYARYRIRGEILDMLRRLDSAPRSLRRWQRAVEQQTRNLSLRLQRLPTDEELSDTLGVDIGKVRRNRQLLVSTSPDHEFPKRLDDDSSFRGRESAADTDWMPDAIHERKESFRLLLSSIERLPVRARRVILLYYRQNLTMKQIGTLLQVNESRVSQIHKDALQTLCAMIQPLCSLRANAGARKPKDSLKVRRDSADMFVSGKV